MINWDATGHFWESSIISNVTKLKEDEQVRIPLLDIFPDL